MRRHLLPLAIGIALVPWAGIAAASGTAAPDYLSSDPGRGEKRHLPPDEVSITFSEPLDSSSTMQVRDECRRRVDDGQVTVFTNEMSVGIDRFPSGHYTVRWTAVGVAGVTGRRDGEFSFHVHSGLPCDGGDGGGHDGHGDGGDGGDGGEDHDRHGDRGGDGTDHGAMDHGGGAPPEHGGHAPGAPPGGRHGPDHRDRRHGHRDRPRSPEDLQAAPPLPLAPLGAPPVTQPPLQAAMAALAAAALVGAIGGGILRFGGR